MKWGHIKKDTKTTRSASRKHSPLTSRHNAQQFSNMKAAAGWFHSPGQIVLRPKKPPCYLHGKQTGKLLKLMWFELWSFSVTKAACQHLPREHCLWCCDERFTVLTGSVLLAERTHFSYQLGWNWTTRWHLCISPDTWLRSDACGLSSPEPQLSCEVESIFDFLF